MDIATGLTYGETAERLVLSESTEQAHVGRVVAKIGARDRIGAVILPYDAKLVTTQPGITRPTSDPTTP